MSNTISILIISNIDTYIYNFYYGSRLSQSLIHINKVKCGGRYMDKLFFIGGTI